MGKQERLLNIILEGRLDANISFRDLLSLLRTLGFEETIRGSHHLFRKKGTAEKINLQRDGNKAKPYQVKQVREIFVALGVRENDDA